MASLGGARRLLSLHVALVAAWVVVVTSQMDPEMVSEAMRHFADVCAHPPAAQRNAVPGPLPESDLESHGLKFVAVNLIFRHGARGAMHDPLGCFAPEMARGVFSECHLRSASAITAQGRGNAQAGGVPPMLKMYHDSYQEQPNASGAGTGCGPAQLLDEARLQFRALALAARDAFFGRLPQEPTRETTWMYSTDTDRTLGSTYLFQDALFGEAEDASEPGRVQTRNFQADAWSCRSPCAVAKAEIAARKKRDFWSGDAGEAGQKRAIEELAERWREAFGKPFSGACHDPVLVSRCSGRLPNATLPHGGGVSVADRDRLMDEAVVEYHWRTMRMYLGHKEAWTLLIAPALLELQEFARRQASGEEKRAFATWATHDTTIVPLLVSLGVWDLDWPQYTETLALEVYRQEPQGASSAGKVYLRFLRRGRVLQVPSCGSSGPLGLCELDSFLPNAVVKFRDRQLWATACSASPLKATVAAEVLSGAAEASLGGRSQGAWLALGVVAVAAAAFLAGGLAGAVFGRRSRTWSRQPLLVHP